jgi:Flp pilus assembly pilin Flp
MTGSNTRNPLEYALIAFVVAALIIAGLTALSGLVQDVLNPAPQDAMEQAP